MRYLILAITILILALTVGSVHADGWKPPAICDDKDREIFGNRTSPCKLPTPQLEAIEYRVRLASSRCYGELIFRYSNIGPMPEEYKFMGAAVFDAEGIENQIHGISSRIRTPSKLTLGEGYIAYRLNSWDSTSSLQSNSVIEGIAKREPGTPVLTKIWVEYKGNIRRHRSTTIPYPNLPGPYEVINLANACFSQLEGAAIQREASRRATIAAQELIALHQEKIQTAENELLKTEALVAEIKFREVAGAILQEIARIRLAGKADRARLLNEHLERLRQSSDDFDIETSAVEDTIQQYINFNEALITEIDGYQTKLQERLVSVTRDIANQQAELDALEEEARNIAIPEDAE